MLHGHDGELDMAEDRNHDDARASTEGEMDARVNQAADSMLSMQLQLAARLNNHFPSVHYSQEGFEQSPSAAQPKNYDCEVSDTSALYLRGDNCSNNDSNHFSELDQLAQRMNTGEGGLQYVRNSIGEKSSLGLSHGHSSQDHGAQCVNLDSEFSQRNKVYSSNHTLASHQQIIQEPVIIYEFPQEQERPGHLYMMNTYGSTCATNIPSQASKMHNQDYHNIAVQHDFEQDLALNRLTDLIQLQGTTFMKEYQPQHVQAHQRHLSLFNNNPSEIRGRSCQGDLQEINRQSTGGEIAAWEGINKTNEDMFHQQEQYDQQQAFLNFLRFSNAPHGGSKFSRRDSVDGKSLYRRSKSPEDEHELLELFDGRSSGSVTVAATAVLHSEASAVNTDRASIVGDTINYIHVLRKQIRELTLKKEKRRERKIIERSQTTGEGCAESHDERPRNYERALSEFRISDENELRLASKRGAAIKFQLTADELHVNIVQKREPYFLNRFLASLTRFDLVNSSGGIIDNHHIQSFILKIKGNLRQVSVKLINNIMDTLDQI
ncbi:hypothetical protein AXG93_2752s2010 [Marchantia polymorpha subsp. ruderalis]|uniref:BHLH domain-containing protein n=1 Tax=Marchantia polymorpha subsp. ruderalis TaxID=1480154 RepID=A0A176VVM4_MARPO|nr:hypothetical protein AXG93_2752s2010 [Marchantia polymorpha subsp. ruderalis]